MLTIKNKNIFFIMCRHDDHRNRRPSTRKIYRRKNDQVMKRTDKNDTLKLSSEDFESPDCLVSEWNEWSQCSKSCGLGEKFRSRSITKMTKKDGVPCPQLTERSWCGSSRCKPSLANENIGNSSYFQW